MVFTEIKILMKQKNVDKVLDRQTQVENVFFFQFFFLKVDLH